MTDSTVQVNCGSSGRNRELETNTTYQVGKTTVSVCRVFQETDAETLTELLVKLIKTEVEKP